MDTRSSDSTVGDRFGRSLSTYLESVRSDLDIVTWTETYHVAKELVACGMGVTIADEVTARSGDATRIQIMPLEPPLRFDIKVLSLAAAPLSVTAQNFVQHLRLGLNTLLET